MSILNMALPRFVVMFAHVNGNPPKEHPGIQPAALKNAGSVAPRACWFAVPTGLVAAQLQTESPETNVSSTQILCCLYLRLPERSSTVLFVGGAFAYTDLPVFFLRSLWLEGDLPLFFLVVG